MASRKLGPFSGGVIRGPAPLGPGASPGERQVAFGHGLLEHLSTHHQLLLAALVVLLGESAPELDAECTAEALLAALGAEVVVHQIRGRGMTLDRVAGGWETIARRVVGARSDCALDHPPGSSRSLMVFSGSLLMVQLWMNSQMRCGSSSLTMNRASSM